MVHMLLTLKTFRIGGVLTALGGISWLAAGSSAIVIGSCGPNGLGFFVMFGMPLLPIGFLLLFTSGVIALVRRDRAVQRTDNFTRLGL